MKYPGLMVAAAFLCVACTGYLDDEISIGADRTEIVADGVDAAALRVVLAGRDGVSRDVTAEATITNTATGEIVSGGVFTTLTPGAYTFTARWEGIPATLPVAIVAVRPDEPPPTSGRFRRRVGILEFTGTWCRYCPDMAGYIAGAGALMPDRHVVLAVHVNDPLAVPYAGSLVDMFRVAALPAAVIDLGAPVSGDNTGVSDMARRIEEIVEGAEATCGIAIATSTEGGVGRVRVTLRSVATAEYGIAVALVEDGVTGYPQLMPDGSVRDGYVHDHTLRGFYGDSVEGVSVGVVAAGEATEREFSFDLAGCRPGKCRAVVFATSRAGGKTVMNNAAECPLGGNADFEYENE